MEYLRDKMNEHATHSKNLCGGIYEKKKDYQPEKIT
jgi:hypothetical protein